MRIFAAVFFLGLASLSAQEIANPGFELELTDWLQRADRNMSGVSEAAARTGALGLRVTDESDSQGSGLYSLPVEAVPGAKYELSCWAKGVSGTGSVGLYLRFLNEREKLAKKEKFVTLPAESREWKRYAVSDVAPEGAVSAQVWIHSFAKDTPVVDIDDIEFKVVPAE